MAQMTVPRSSTVGNDVEDQTRYLFHRCVHDLTRDSESSLDSGNHEATLNHKAFEEMSHGPADSGALEDLQGCLQRYAVSMQNDSVLQRELEKLKQHFNKETLWKLCRKIFSTVDNVWNALVTLFAFGLGLCRKVALILYDTIVDTIIAAVMEWASAWLVENGGWVAMVAGRGVLTGMMETLTSLVTWLKPSSGSTSE